MSSRDPNLLDPTLKDMWFKLHNAALGKNIQIILTCTYRSNEEQAELYKSGRTIPGDILTHAMAGQSLHNFNPSKAFDIAILRGGKCVWDTKDPAWKTVSDLAIAIGLKWGGNWPEPKTDYPHFELA